jgi:uncharacterized membrane protein YhhN
MRGKVYNGLFILYIVAAVISVVARAQGWQSVLFIFKPLMLLSLSLWFYFNTRAFGDRFTLLIQAGLFFSLLGDIALLFMYKDEFAFLIGLAMFMITHLCYTVAFGLNIADAKAPPIGIILPSVLSIVWLGLAYWFSGVLMPRVDEIVAVPVGTYLFIVTMMAVAATYRWQRTFKRSWFLVVIGVLLFLLHDGFLARDRFINPIEHESILISATYATAQMLIAIGCVWHVRSPTHMRKQEVLKA